MQEFALNDTGVLLGWLIDANSVICQVEGNDKSAVDVLRHARVETGCEAQNLSTVIHRFEEVFLRLLRLKFVLLAQGILLVAKSVVGRVLARGSLSWLSVLDLSEREVYLPAVSVVALGEHIDTGDIIDDTISVDATFRGDLISSKVVVANMGLAWLFHVECVGELATTKVHREAICAIVGEVALTDLNGVIGEVVVHSVGLVRCTGEESEHAAIIVEELLLGLHSATTELLLHEVFHLRVALLGNGLLALLEGVTWG